MPTRAGEQVKPEYVLNPDGTVKRDKNGKLVRKRRPKPKTLEIKDEEGDDLVQNLEEEGKASVSKKNSCRKRKTVVEDKTDSQGSDNNGPA